MPEPHGPMQFDSSGDVVKRKQGGNVSGKAAKKRADKKARGGKNRAAKGHKSL